MKNTLFAFACLALLSGCADMDMDHLLSFDETADTETVATEAPVSQSVAAQPPGDAFCRAVAVQDSQNNVFDPATQRRILTQSYSQCMAIGLH